MAIEIVDLPMKNGGSFQCYVSVLPIKNGDVHSLPMKNGGSFHSDVTVDPR